MNCLILNRYFMYDLKKLKNLFDKISYTSSEMSSFLDILDFTLLPFRYYENCELLNEAHQKLQRFPKNELIAEFITELADLNLDGFADPLGEFYMIHISYGRLGQALQCILLFYNRSRCNGLPVFNYLVI